MSILNISYIAQNVRLFVQWLFVSEMHCNPQAYGVWARQGLQLIPKYPRPRTLQTETEWLR